MLPLNPKIPWPPRSWQSIYDEYTLRAAWYGADMNALAGLYHRGLANQNNPGALFWAHQTRSERRALMHMPLTGDIASLSASLLFSEAPKIRIPEVDEKTAAQEALAAQASLETMLDETMLFARMIEAADTASGMGGVFLKVAWDRVLSKQPIPVVTQVDAAVPEFQFGILTACTFWQTLEDDGRTVWRLLERHEPSVILTGLYEGNQEKLGAARELTTRADTAGIPPEVETGLDGLACWYVPNALPNRKRRDSSLGRADTDGAESMLDSLDEVFTSWLNDIRVGRGRLSVPMGTLKKSGNEFVFDLYDTVFVEMETPMTNDPLPSQMMSTQFAIRFAEHQGTTMDWMERIVSFAQYAPQSLGLKIDGAAQSGTALRMRERKSFITTAKKAAYWKPVIQQMIWAMQVIARKHLGASGQPFGVNVEMQDSVRSDVGEVATTCAQLRAAQAASTEVLVMMAHPDWGKPQVDAEVERIQDEQGLAVPDLMQAGVA